ncbi:MAG: hypothetical protein IPH94_17425 [Saprospiraceae bacterium]|nr:hypothetical protein [Saprospiraceae bacterium]
MKLKISLFVVFLLSLGACSLHKKIVIPSCNLGSFVFNNCTCSSNSSSTDSLESILQSGFLSGEGFKLQYQYGPSVPKGPQDAREYIEQSFRAYYYKNFFEYIHIDSKVHKVYRDSVYLTEIVYIRPGEDQSCSACNVQLQLMFKGNTIPFSIFITPSLLTDLNKAGFSYPLHTSYRIKLFNHPEIKGAWLGSKKRSKGQPSLYLEMVEGDWALFEKWISLNVK